MTSTEKAERLLDQMLGFGGALAAVGEPVVKHEPDVCA